MANKITYTAGTNQLPLTASRFTADTSGGNVTLGLPSISEMQNFQERGSGLNVSGTFNFAFEKIGSGQLIFNIGVEGDTINGSRTLVVNDIGSGIIFISSDNSWGIVNFSQSANQNNTSKVDVSIAQFNASAADAPIIVVPAKADALIVPSFIIITIVEADGSGVPVRVAYGYNGLTPIGNIDITGLIAGTKIIVPIIAPVNYVPPQEPNGAGFVFYKTLGSNTSLKLHVPYIEIEGFSGN